MTEAPWLQEGEIPAYRSDGGRPKAAKAGLTIFLAVALCLFSLMSAASSMRMESTRTGSRRHCRAILWFNTAVLVVSSVALHLAQSRGEKRGLGADEKRVRGGRRRKRASSSSGQLWAWREMVVGGFYASQNPANAFFFLLTGAHALHLMGGLFALFRAATQAWRQEDSRALAASVELCAIYWHFLLVVWLLLFALLIGWADNLGVICRRLLS